MRGMNQNTGRALSGMAHLKQSVRRLLTTPKGSRVMRCTYGSRLFELIDNPLTAETLADIIAETAGVIQAWEPRINVQKVTVQSLAAGRVVLSITGQYKPDGQPINLEGIDIE